MRIVQRVDPLNAESYFSLHQDENHYYYFSIDDGLGMGRKENGDRNENTADAALIDAAPDALTTCGGTVIERQDFTDDAMLAATFSVRHNANGSSIAIRDRQLVATPGNPTGYAEIYSNTLRSFSGLTAQVRVDRAAGLAFTDTFFDIHTPVNDRVYFSIGPTQIEMARKGANGTVTQTKYIDYVPNSHRYLRLEQRGNNFNFLTSADGGDWTQRHTATIVGFNLSQVGVGIGAGAYPDGSSTPSTAIFDELELCGP